MSAVYWRGGDDATERVLYRPQYFDKIVAWGGGDAINNVIKYLMPGFQLVSFDPKTSISMVGREAHADEATQIEDVLIFKVTEENDEFVFETIEDEDELNSVVDAYNELLDEMGEDEDEDEESEK